ncbi:TPA: IS3 family transposase, partial [Escherichia coli]
FGGKTSIFSHPVYLFLREFSLQDSRGGSPVYHVSGSYNSCRGTITATAGRLTFLYSSCLSPSSSAPARQESVIVHTDRGGQYCSGDYQAMLKRHNLRGSMSAKGYCYDNACVESFFHSLKVECIHGERFSSREIMWATVFNYIECDYNRWRRHSACGGLSPEQFENHNLA